MDPEEARKRLEAEKARVGGLIRELHTEIDGEAESDDSELSNYDQHPADSATDTFEREKDLGILDDLEAELAEIEAAIERIENGTYGIDEVTGEPIDPARLDAIPVGAHQPGHRHSHLTPPPTTIPGAPHTEGTDEEHAMGFAIDKLGQWTEGPEFKVEAERTKAYALATNDPIPADLSGEVAPPVFAVVPIWDTIAGAMAGVVPPEVLMLVVHGEQDMRLVKPITPGMVLSSKAAPVGIHVKPNGTTVVVKVESRDQSGDLVVEQYMTSFFRGVSDGEGKGEDAPKHKLEGATKATDPVGSITQQIDMDQTYRYAEASGDNMPIHLDAEIAKSVGLPGIIIHGLCTMAFTSWAAIQEVCGGDPSRLKRLAVRFSRPVLPGQAITTTFWAAGEADGNQAYGFETRNGDGEVVIKDGLAEVAP